jgi:hypothetical protein
MNAPLAKRTERDGRNLYIDMLRGICILLVMLLHYSLSYHLQVSPLQEWVSIPTLRAIFYNGNYGVDIFFVISGFLITSNTLDRYGSLADVDIAHFYKLRFFRLYPLVIVVLVIITVLGVAGLSNFSNIHRGKNLGDNFFLIADISVLTFWHNMLLVVVSGRSVLPVISVGAANRTSTLATWDTGMSVRGHRTHLSGHTQGRRVVFPVRKRCLRRHAQLRMCGGHRRTKLESHQDASMDIGDADLHSRSRNIYARHPGS